MTRRRRGVGRESNANVEVLGADRLWKGRLQAFGRLLAYEKQPQAPDRGEGSSSFSALEGSETVKRTRRVSLPQRHLSLVPVSQTFSRATQDSYPPYSNIHSPNRGPPSPTTVRMQNQQQPCLGLGFARSPFFGLSKIRRLGRRRIGHWHGTGGFDMNSNY